MRLSKISSQSYVRLPITPQLTIPQVPVHSDNFPDNVLRDDAQTFSISRGGSFGFKTIHWGLCVCFQSNAYLYLSLELGVFITQQLVPFWSLESKTKQNHLNNYTKSTTAGNILEGSKYISCSSSVLSLLLKYFSHFLPKNVILLRNLTELPLGKNNKFRLPIFHFSNPSFFHFSWYTFAACPHFSFVLHVSNEGKGKLVLTKKH